MSQRQPDSLLTSARREALVVLAVWSVALVYSISYCYQFGYGRSVDDLTFVLGFPDWVYWGVVAPWCVCFAISFWFSFRFMRDEPLGEDSTLEETGDGQV